MRSTVGFAILLLSLSSGPALADPCVLNLVTHGTFQREALPDGTCLLFVDDLGSRYEVVNPRGSWRDGMSGTLYGNFSDAPACGLETPVEICSFDADYSRNVSGTLEFVNFIECPGFVIRAGTGDYLIRNCEDFGSELCDLANLGRKVKAQVTVDTGVSICLGLYRSLVVDYRFLQ